MYVLYLLFSCCDLHLGRTVCCLIGLFLVMYSYVLFVRIFLGPGPSPWKALRGQVPLPVKTGATQSLNWILCLCPYLLIFVEDFCYYVFIV